MHRSRTLQFLLIFSLLGTSASALPGRPAQVVSLLPDRPDVRLVAAPASPPPDDPARVIVLFDAPPGAGPSRFAGLAGDSATFQVEQELGSVVSGVVALASPADVARLQALEGVAQVAYEQTLHVTLSDSLPRLGVPAVWQMQAADGSPLNGAGLTVAVLDTGVDYTHPALGGCLGDGCVVAGGWDFVNDDADPMDDYGHGTHVAGIIASRDPQLRGVAPGARLLAYKVCDNSGACLESKIIAALAQAVSDGAQVINLSLGGPGSPDSPLSLAVNATAEQGVVVVASAGNEGLFSDANVGSPGNAAGAITVGATDKHDAMALFSSRGGGEGGLLKPDLVATGVNIYSTALGGGFISMSGTSMAAPHLAGAAALLLQRHPGWLPADVKSALAGTARPLAAAYDAYAQGAGLAQVAMAAAPGLLLSPSSFSFSLGNPSEPVKSYTRTVALHNPTGAPLSVRLSPLAMPGVQASMSPASLSLPPGASASAALSWSVTLAGLGSAPKASGLLRFLEAGSGQELARLPFGFTRSIPVTLAFDEIPFAVILHNREKGSFQNSYYPSATQLSLSLPPDVYDLVVVYRSLAHLVVREGLALTSQQTVRVSRSEAKNAVRFRYRKDGSAGSLYEQRDHVLMASESLVYDGSPLEVFSTSWKYLLGHEALYFSDIRSGRYRFDLSALVALEGGSGWYDFSYGFEQLAGSLDLFADVSGMQRLALPLAPRGDGAPYYLGYAMTHGSHGMYTFLKTVEKVSSEQAVDLYLQPAGDGFGFSYRRVSACLTSSCFDSLNQTTKFFETPYLQAGDAGVDQLLRYAAGSQPPGALSRVATIAGELPVNRTASFWSGQFDNRQQEIALGYDVSGYDWELPFRKDLSGSLVLSPIQYRVYLDGALQRSGNLFEELIGSVQRLTGWEWGLPHSGPVRVELGYTDQAAGASTSSRITAWFDTTRPDANPPTTHALLYCTDRSASPASPAVYLYAGDESGISAVAFEMRAGASSAWAAAPVERQSDTIFRIPMDALPPGSPASIRFSLQDPFGNRIEQETQLTAGPGPACPATLYAQWLAPRRVFLPLARR